MPAFAPAALATAVALSALGAVVLCVLVVLYGFPAGDEDSPERATRRLVVTRVGHALAATCFTATAILIATVLVQHEPPPDSQVPALGEQVAGQEARLSETEARIRELQDALRRREVAPVQPVPERTAPAPAVQRPAVSRPSPPTPVRPAPRTSVRPTDEMAASEAPALAASPPTWPTVPPAPPRVFSAPVPAPSPSPPITAAPPPARPPEAAPEAPSAPRSTPRQALDVPSRLREDWREIQRGVDSAGDDFRSAVQGLRRRLLGQ